MPVLKTKAAKPVKPSSTTPDAGRNDAHLVHLPPLIKDFVTHTAARNARYAIRGVLVEKRGKRLTLVATDGHRMAILEQPADPRDRGPDLELIVPGATLKALRLPRSRTNGAYAVGQVDAVSLESLGVDNAWSLTAGDQTLRLQPESDCNFPPYRDVVPPDLSNTRGHPPMIEPSVWLNPAYLADAAILAERLIQRSPDHNTKPAARWQHRKASQPVRLDAHAGDAHLTVVVMPVSPPDAATKSPSSRRKTAVKQ